MSDRLGDPGGRRNGAASTGPERSIAYVHPDRARAMIAAAMLETAPVHTRLGGIDLAPHQREAVARLRREIARSGGALLADAVGLGKTYVAIALAAEARRPLIVAPAALRGMWSAALERTGVRASFITSQRLSRGQPTLDFSSTSGSDGARGGQPDFVIVDEAHHFRNPATRRYAALAELVRHARVLLLSATPVHNTSRDLDALLALHLGASAASLDEAERARCIIRREAAGGWGDAAPSVSPTHWLELPHDDHLLDAVVALPPPVPPADGDDAGALLLFSLLRQWASSEGALSAALRRRLARAAALIASLEEGRHPSKAELSAWRFAEDAVQLAFPGLIASEAQHSTVALLAQARMHEEATRALLRRVVEGGRTDVERAALLRALRVEHRGERIVAFSQFADTVDALWRELRGDPGVCALAGRGARVAGGPISRETALARFAPRATGVAPPSDAGRIDLLLTTDLLSEGVNLQDASVLVHLDLPWTPARVEQRIGRLARPGAARSRIAVYAFAPPARAESVLAVERRLREKLRAAARAVGVSGMILPGFVGDATEGGPSAAQHGERVRSMLAAWQGNAAESSRESTNVAVMPSGDTSAIALVCSPREGCLALVPVAGHWKLVASLGSAVSDDPAVVADAVEMAAECDAVPLHEGAPVSAAVETIVEDRLAGIERWLAARRGANGVELRLVSADRARRVVMRRAASILARAPRHERARFADMARDARQAAAMPLGSGAERVLRELADAELPDEGWLRAVAAFGSAHRRLDDEVGETDRRPRPPEAASSWSQEAAAAAAGRGTSEASRAAMTSGTVVAVLIVFVRS